MVSFSDYISFWAITNVLINKRIQLGDKLHKKHMLHLLSPKLALGETTDTDKQLLAMMPSRKQWVGSGKKSRFRQLDGEHRQKRAAAVCNALVIRRSIERDLKEKEMPLYLERLQEFVAQIQARVQDKAFSFHKPELFPDEKDDTCSRPLCKFTNLEDSVIVILANKYLTELFDGFFYDESLAFRFKRTYHGMADTVTSHHDAIVRIKEYRNRWEGKKLYVSECDLKKFYDTVSHSVVRKCYKELLRKATKETPGMLFDDISRVFYAYLQCYSFPRDVYYKIKPETDPFWDEHKVRKGRCFKWAEKELLDQGVAKNKSSLKRMHIGVPQGGALSGLIANMVLNTVDWQMRAKMTKRDLYIRYCDDMIIISTSKERCKNLFAVYYNGTKKLNLVPHKAENNLKFGQREFWKGKSKDAYLWEMKCVNAAEWIGFVGYEIRRDGMIRIRRKSFRKELKKQREVVFEKVLDKIEGNDRVPDKSLIGSLEMKLVSMSVGKMAVWNADFMEGEMCWSTGFRELEMNPYLERQLHELDHHRGMILNAAERRIKSMNKKAKVLYRKDLEELETKKNPDSRGMVHSYYYQFKRKEDIDTK